MAGGMSRMAKQELLTTIRDRYRGSSRKDKGRILDEFITVTGHHRKHGIRLLGRLGEDADQMSGVKGRRDLRRGRSGGGDPGVGSIGPHLREASESGATSPGGVHGTPLTSGPGPRSPGAAAVRQRGHAGPVATGPRYGGQPAQTPP